jgi:MtfA peptidase
VLSFLKRRRREGITAAPFPEEWRAIIDENMPYARRLSPEDRGELEEHVQVFLAEKSFEGCGGLEITDEIRVTIAAHACLLLLRRKDADYPDLESILVYPTAYVARSTRHEGGVVIESDDVRLGESWHRGTVVLAWDSVLHGAAGAHDGHNVVLHEFAHQLDAEDGEMDGAPALPVRAMYTAWARVLGDEYKELCERVHRARPSDLDAYGAQSPPEFFAVVTEAFFEAPRRLKKRHPELYDQLAAFYEQDPAATP